MKSAKPPAPVHSSEEIVALIEILHQTGQRLEQLTGGEVDAVANRAGQTILLQHAQEQLRLNESARQAAILNALPASIALLDSQGKILSVNAAWQGFGRANAVHYPGHGVGVNYLAICDQARGDDATEAGQAAAGIRAVLNGKADTFALEYPCHSPAEQRWFLMTVSPLAGASKGVVVMHLNITASMLAENALCESEARFQRAVTGANDGIWEWLPATGQDYLSPRWKQLLGYEDHELHNVQESFFNQIHPEDRTLVEEAVQAHIEERKSFTLELRLRCKSGEYRWFSSRGQAEWDDQGRPLRMSGSISDITERKRAEAALRDRAAELAESQRIARIGSWEWTPATGVVVWSDGMNHVLVRDLALGTPNFENMPQFYTAESWQRLGAAIATTLETGAPYDLELEMIRADGATCWTTTRGEAIRGADGTVVKLHGTVHDITERRKAKARIVQLNRVLLVLSSINTLIVRVNDRDELFREACNIAVDAGGFRMAMLVVVDPVTMLPVSISSAGKHEELLTEIKKVLSSGESMQKSLFGQTIRQRKTAISNDTQNDPRLSLGKQYSEAGVKSMAILPLVISGKTLGMFALYASELNFFQKDEMKLLTDLAGDIAYAIDYIGKQDKLNYLAYYDVLTGLANRTLFLERMAQHIHRASSDGHKLAIALIDLERFKNVNDSLGRPAGDALLKQVAEWLTQIARDASLLARIDADHFAFVLPEVRADGNLAKLVDNIAKTFQAHPFKVDNTELRLAAKTGIALFPDDGAEAETVYRNAEAALKSAKKSGDRYLFHTKKMTEAVAAKLTLENQLRQAIDNEEFVLYYQPKVNLLSGRVTGAEALLRWNDPRTGLVAPGMFIPVLEETGLISEVGRWALRQAITDYLRWRDAGLPAVRIAVNVSPLQLRNIDFIDEIRQVIAPGPHAAEGLELEITESVIMDNIEFNITALQAIRALGVTIAIDDFGTGFSSLSYLAKLPVDTLKIDRAFVIEMTANPEGLSLVSTIINLAHALKRKVVAEGVETEGQSRLLRLLGCDEMQGFLFSKPVPADIFEAKFLSRATD